MASRALQLCFFFTLLFLLLLSSFSNSVMSSRLILKRNIHNLSSLSSKSSSLNLKKLQGCRYGDKVEGVSQLKKYLQRFGYYVIKSHHVIDDVDDHVHDDDDIFDGLLESAIKSYQKNFNLPVTGILDANTIAQMSIPRCGVADIHGGSNYFHTVTHYAFFENNLKWPISKSNLTYAFLPGYPSEAIPPVSRAFMKWASIISSNSNLRFSKISNHKIADIKISFERGDHGDDTAFDGRGGVLAHAYPPTDGRLHFDIDEPWSVGAISGYFDVETVALHEIGHILGLQHSSVQNAIMFPSISAGSIKGLHPDDIAGIKALYGF